MTTLSDLSEYVSELIRLGKGDPGRLGHIKSTLENKRTLYLSDKKYVEDLVSKYILNKKTAETSSFYSGDENEERWPEAQMSLRDEINYSEKSASNLHNSHTNHSKLAVQISLVIGIGIAIIVIFLGLNIYAISNLQFRNYQTDEPDLADMSMNVKLEACNTTFFPAILKQFNIDVIYKSTNFATFTINDENIAPHSSSIIDGRLKVNSEAIVNLFLTSLGSAFSGEKTELKNPEELRYIAKFDVPILGIIPFSVTQEYSQTEFQSFMNSQTEKFSC